MNCGFRKELFFDTLECIIKLDSLIEHHLKRDIVNRFFKKYKIEEDFMLDFFFYEILHKRKDSSKEKRILFRDLADKFCDYYMESKMKNCCNCCKCCCQNKCCNKKDDEAIKINVEKEIEMFVSELKSTSGQWWYDVYVLFRKKIKNTPTIEIKSRSQHHLLDYIEDSLTSNHRCFSIIEKIEAIEHLNKFVKIRAEEWLSGIKNAIR